MSSILLRFTDDTFKALAIDDRSGFQGKDDEEGEDGKDHDMGYGRSGRFRTLTSSYYRGAHGIMLVYGVTRKHALSQLQRRLEEVTACGSNARK